MAQRRADGIGDRDDETAMGPIERATADLLLRAHDAAAHELPALFAAYGRVLGGADAVACLADLQQEALTPFLGVDASEAAPALLVDSTMAGQAYQLMTVRAEPAPGGGTRVWLPLLDGRDRLGVLGVTVTDWPAADGEDLLAQRLATFASLVTQLLVTKTMYGDTLVRLRRRGPVGLTAEMQWGLLPPLSFASDHVVLGAALEPAYEVAGDTVDYAVDAGRARFAIFDGMGHSLQSAQLAALAVSAYRNARRNQLSLTATAESIDRAVLTGFGGDTFVTGLLAELDTGTGALTWVSAGHPEPLLVRETQVVRTLACLPSLPFGLNAPLASGDSDEFAVGSERLAPGDRVLLYTDGVVEARARSGAFFGLDRLTDFLAASLVSGLPVAETLRRLVRSILEHHDGRLTDDATLLLVEWPGRAPSPHGAWS